MITDKLEALRSRIHPEAGIWAIECPKGWEDLVAQLDLALSTIDPDYQILQVKEKLGGLRYYCTHHHDEVCGPVPPPMNRITRHVLGVTVHLDERLCSFFKVVQLAEERSYHTCLKCGSPGGVTSINGWLTTLCAKHLEEAENRE